jgi:hypothetical protein
MVANLDTNTFRIPIVNVTGTKTLALTDANTVQDCTNTALMTINIPTNATVPFPIGTQVAIKRRSTLAILIAGAVGVTVVDDQGNALGVGAQVEFFGRLYKLGADSWQLIRSIPDNPILPGNNATAFTQALNNNSTRVATTAYVNTSNRPYLHLSLSANTGNFAANSWNRLNFDTETTDTNNVHSTTTNLITIPTGLGGTYAIHASALLNANIYYSAISIFSETTANEIPCGRIANYSAPTTQDVQGLVSGSTLVDLVAGTNYSIQFFHGNVAIAQRSILSGSLTCLKLYRLNV